MHRKKQAVEVVAVAESAQAQVNETKSEGLARGYEMTIPAAALSNRITEKLREQQKTFSMKGFRQGKAPLSLMRQMFGKSMLGEAIQEVVDTSVGEIITENKHKPAMTPNIKVVNEDFEEGDDLKVAVEYELLPDVPPIDFGSLGLERLVVEVEQASVDEALENLAKEAPNFEARAAGAAAANDDQVVIDFDGKLDGESFEGGAAEDFPLVLGSNQFVPGFEEQLVGAKAGDEKQVSITMPENYGNAELAGKDVVFDTKVKEVREPKPATMDDEFAKRFGVETVSDLRDSIKERVGAEFVNASRAHIKRKLLDELDEKVDFELPPTMLDLEAKQVAHQLWHEENPEVQGHDHPEIEPSEEHTKIARRRVMLGLLLAHVGSENEITVSEDELREGMFAQARQYPGQERQYLEWLQSNPQAVNEIQAPIFEDKVVDHILGLANVSEKSVTKEELQSALEALEVESV